MLESIIILLWISFLYINIHILLSDTRKKIIPNKKLLHLIYILPIYYFVIIQLWNNILFEYIFYWFLLTLCISFCLYFFWVWAAGDSKYLIVLSLYFLEGFWVIWFFWNIWIIILLYILAYSIISVWKLKNKYVNKASIRNIAVMVKETSFITLYSFFLFFFFLRLIRELINKSTFNEIIDDYKKALWIGFIICIILIFKIAKYFIKPKLRKFDKSKIIKKIFIFFTIWLLLLILYWYSKLGVEIFFIVRRIVTFNLLLLILFMLLFKGFKEIFIESETYQTYINNMQVWEIVSTTSLKNQLHDFKHLQNQKWIKSDKELFKDIRFPLTHSVIENIQQRYNYINDYIWDENKWEKLEYIKMVKTMSFWWFIFMWFLITYFFEDTIIKLLYKIIVWLYT